MPADQAIPEADTVSKPDTISVLVVDDLRAAVEAQVIRRDDIILRMTISLGVAERTPVMKGPDDLLHAADDALYAAKDAGRNTVRLAGTKRKPSLSDANSITLADAPMG